MTSFREFFVAATKKEPYDYQARLASLESEEAVVSVPTGAGKTAAVVLAWLWRLQRENGADSKRLVYCLPMRSLTEQTATVARDFLRQLGLEKRVGVHVLMGGESDESWYLQPERPAIIVGTQDMILSRILNRGYAMNPLRWPLPFGLLACYSTWIFDEIQLMADGLATTLQFQSFRKMMQCYGEHRSIWMSATCRPEWLETVDHPIPEAATVVTLSEKDQAQLEVRLHANKLLQRAPQDCRMPKGLAQFVLECHVPDTLSLVVVNTVARAVETYKELRKGADGSKLNVQLLHSRFRPIDRRKRWQDLLLAARNGDSAVVVATQVIEAGVDISAKTMVTDVAPYASLVQRFGRLNRAGEAAEAACYWVDRPLIEKHSKLLPKDELTEREREAIASPYAWMELESARRKLETLKSASPAALPKMDGIIEFEHVPRRRDLLDLFDTSPDLSGNHVDISRFVRGGDDRDVAIAWRKWEDPETSPPSDLAALEHRELCRIPLHQVTEFAKTNRKVWGWQVSLGRWEEVRPDRLVPGMRLVAHVSAGGYTSDEGWNPESRLAVDTLSKDDLPPEEWLGNDPLTFRKFGAQYQQSLAAHTNRVVEELGKLLANSRGVDLGDAARALRRAARLHDWGKALSEFQKTLREGEPPSDRELLAKSCANGRHARRHLRHELASALAALESGETPLVAYLIAAHHGRIRLTIRSMPEEPPGRMRGLEVGDPLLAADLGDGTKMDDWAVILDAATIGRRKDGRSSWTDCMVRLRDEFGPFRLAYLEALLRIADERASAEPGEEVDECRS